MTQTQPPTLDELFNTHAGTQIDPERAATALGDILGFFHGELTGSSPISQGIGTQTASTTTDTTTQQPATTVGATTGDRSSPVPEGTTVSQGFGAGNETGGHPGIDFAVPLDTQLLAAASGTVTHSSNDDPGGYGEWVEITTGDGFKIRYGHLHSTNVNVGDTVRAGQIIGTSGGEAGGPTAGNSTGPHLHFEVDVDGHAIDPTPFLAGGYQIVGGPATSPTPQTADPRALAAVQLQNVVNVLGGKPAQDLTQPATTAATTATSGATQSTGNFASDILAGIGAPSTPENIRFIEAWMRAEGGASHNNPLNTTQGAPGATDFNSVGVKTYTSYEQGVTATIQTLLNGMYGPIIDALKAGTSAQAAAAALAASPWGTGALVQQILGGG